MKQKIVRRASALVLAGCLLAGAALPALAASAKEEVIYANLDASGTVTGVYAVNSFAVQAGDTVTDHGSYTAVRNMTTTDPLKHSGDTITATYRITEVNEARRKTTGECVMTNQRGEIVLTCLHYMKVIDPILPADG